MTPTDFEKLGAFYLGLNLEAGAEQSASPVLLESRDLVTHAVCVGMTGSGKTGLCIALLEEAAIDGVPAIVIDPKGDLANLALAFPQMRPEELAPFLDPSEAARQGLTVEGLAAKLGDQWRAGWAQSGQDPERVARYRDSATVRVFTPGSSAGLPLSPLGALLPPAAIRQDDEARREHCATSAAALLALIDEDTAPTAPAFVLLTLILDAAAREDAPFDLATLMHRVQAPPFERVGLLDVETFLPAKARQAVVTKLNAVLASPSMAAWLSGAALDAGTLLVGDGGKPCLSIISVAHLSDTERMVFVARLLAELLAWTRAQRGTQSLRALLFIDEVMGYMPPVANPPSKAPLMTLMKQGRAFGVGVVLATQNPVDLDYKALANTGTWLVGRLQTERDRARVLDGLEGASVGVDRRALDALLGSLQKRQFVLARAQHPELVRFQSRTTLSFLAGPLPKEQLRALAQLTRPGTAAPAAAAAPAAPAATARPILEAGVVERFAAQPRGDTYSATACAALTLRARDPSSRTQLTRTVWLQVPLSAELSWRAATGLEKEPAVAEQPQRPFGPLPAGGARKATWDAWCVAVVDEVVNNRPLEVLACPGLAVVQADGMSVDAFKAAVLHAAREARDAETAKLKARFQPRLDALDAKLRRAQERVRKEESQASSATLDTALTVGGTLLGALFGRKTLSQANLRRASQSARKATRAVTERGDVAAANDEVARLEDEASALSAEFAAEQAAVRAVAVDITTIKVPVTKAGVTVEKLWLLWS